MDDDDHYMAVTNSSIFSHQKRTPAEQLAATKKFSPTESEATMIMKSSISDLSEGSVFSTGVYTSTTDFNSDLLTSDSEKLRRSSFSEPNLYENNLSPSSASEAGVIPADVACILRQHQQQHHHLDKDEHPLHHHQQQQQQQQQLTRTISGDLKEICKIFQKRYPDASKLVKKSYMPRTISGDLGEIRR